LSGPLRWAGRGSLPDGTLVTWSVAEGTRGRRWRATTTVDGRLRLGALLELDLDGRPTRLELVSSAGLLTLHPDGENGRLHGNVVRAEGVDHLAVDWGAGHEMWVAGLPLVIAAVVPRLATLVGVGEGIERPAVRVDAALRPQASRSTPAAVRQGWAPPPTGRSSSRERSMWKRCG